MQNSTNLNKLILNIARGAISDKLFGTKSIDKEDIIKKIPNFRKMGATFVTLTIDGNLRGCIGSLVPRRAMLDDILSNAQAAAFNDPRFPPLTKEEFDKIKIEVSILSQAVEIRYKNFKDLENKISKGNDGVIIRQGNKQATFLPQVWEQLPSFEDFMTHLFHKASITDLDTPIDVFVYQVEKIEEE